MTFPGTKYPWNEIPLTHQHILGFNFLEPILIVTNYTNVFGIIFRILPPVARNDRLCRKDWEYKGLKIKKGREYSRYVINNIKNTLYSILVS